MYDEMTSIDSSIKKITKTRQKYEIDNLKAKMDTPLHGWPREKGHWPCFEANAENASCFVTPQSRSTTRVLI